MKSLLKHGTTTGSKPLETIDMQIVDNQNMQDQVIKGVYDDPARAFPRELLCNGGDACVVAGNPTRPVEVTLPTKLQPLLTIRDFGRGMTEEVIKDVYAKIGMSDKRESGMVTGEKGLGAKSPLAYRDSFNLTCYDDKEFRFYSICYSEMRKAQVLLLARGPNDGSTDPNTGQVYPHEERGVEINIAVNDSDVDLFCENVRELIADFAHPFSNGAARPVIVTGNPLHCAATEQVVLGNGSNASQSGPDINSWDDAHMVTPYVGYRGELGERIRQLNYRYRNDASADFYNANVKYQVKDLLMLMGGEKEQKEAQRKYPIATRLELVFFVPLLNPKDELPYISTTAGRDTIQPHERTTAWLNEVLTEFEAGILEHVITALLASEDYFDAHVVSEAMNLNYLIDHSNSLTTLLPTIEKGFKEANRACPSFKHQYGCYSGTDTHHGLMRIRELINQFCQTEDLPTTWEFKSYSSSKAFTRNKTQAAVWKQLAESKTIYVIDEHTAWKARLSQATPGVSTDRLIIMTPDRAAAPKVKANKAKVKAIFDKFGVTCKFISDLPKYVVERITSVTKSKGKAQAKVGDLAFRKFYNSYQLSQQWPMITNSKLKNKLVEDNNSVYIVLNGYSPTMWGESCHFLGDLLSLLETNNVHAIHAGLSLTLDDPVGEYKSSRLVGIRKTEMPKSGMGGHTLFEDWLLDEFEFLQPLIERHAMSKLLSDMCRDRDLDDIRSVDSKKKTEGNLIIEGVKLMVPDEEVAALKEFCNRRDFHRSTEAIYAHTVFEVVAALARKTTLPWDKARVKSLRKFVDKINGIVNKSDTKYHKACEKTFSDLLTKYPLLPTTILAMKNVRGYHFKGMNATWTLVNRNYSDDGSSENTAETQLLKLFKMMAKQVKGAHFTEKSLPKQPLAQVRKGLNY